MKKASYGAFIALGIASIMSISSCQKEKLNINSTNDSVSKSIVSDEHETILGDKLPNPFGLSNMQDAYESLGESTELESNQYYVRFKVSSVKDLEKLEDLGLILSTIPLDVKVEQYGVYYNDPNLTNETWIYTTVNPNFDFNDFEYEIIERLFLPKLLIGTSKYDDLFQSFDHEDLIDMALKLKGYEDETEEKAIKYRPKGYVKVSQSINGITTNVPVKNLHVRSRWWFDYGNAYTSDNGYFECDELYRKNRKVNIIYIFGNSTVKIRAIKGLQFWDIFFTERKNSGQYQNSALENINYTFGNSSDISSDTKRKWMACHAINSVREYRVYAGQNGVAMPGMNLNLWLTNANSNGTSMSAYAGAPMLKQMAGSSQLLNIIEFFLIASGHPWFAASLQVLESVPPDITYNYSENEAYYENSDQISEIFYHELAHASHYQQVGNNYWSAYIGYMILHGNEADGYGYPTNFDAGRIAISEAWAEFCGSKFAHIRYGNNTSYPSGWDTWEEYIERFKPNVATNWKWIPEGVMHDLIDNGEASATLVDDQVSGYTIADCFDAMDSDVLTVLGYRNRFIQENGTGQQNAVNSLFKSYGYF